MVLSYIKKVQQIKKRSMETKKNRREWWQARLQPSTPLFISIILAIFIFAFGCLGWYLFSSVDISDLEISSIETKRTCITDSLQLYEIHSVQKVKIEDDFIVLPANFEDTVFLISKNERKFIEKNVAVKSTISLIAEHGTIIKEEKLEKTDLKSLKQLGKFKWLFTILPKITGVGFFILCVVLAFPTLLSFLVWAEERKTYRRENWGKRNFYLKSWLSMSSAFYCLIKNLKIDLWLKINNYIM